MLIDELAIFSTLEAVAVAPETGRSGDSIFV